ncbi:hypothetical protein [Rubrivivax albus]|uniref:Uncharacterized protein n=1 Tax=Rubrivivax albus TaxID=2499835 RepID=A0A3S2X0E7_9BURK|nr:hypothetical protein [Rubrivivax albus]RVT50797.1 hypothetical protein ENE75_13340 [Rubrivivax albus]
MGSEHAPLILIELVLVFGSVLVFAWWQLRSVERDRRETQRQREADAAAAARTSGQGGSPAQTPPTTEDVNDDRAR